LCSKAVPPRRGRVVRNSTEIEKNRDNRFRPAGSIGPARRVTCFDKEELMKQICNFCAAIMVVLMATISTAGVPMAINYQGRLTNASGQPVADGDYLVRFIIYDAPTGGNVLWDDDYRAITVKSGLFTYALGDSTTLPADMFATGAGRYLAIRVGADPELAPRVRLTSAAFAFQALRSDSAAFASVIADNTVSSAKIQDGSIGFADIGSNGAASGQVMKWNGVAWSAAGDETGASSGWVDNSTIVSLQDDSDMVGIGTSTPGSKLDIVGDIHSTGHMSLGSSSSPLSDAVLSIDKQFTSQSWATGIRATVKNTGSSIDETYGGEFMAQSNGDLRIGVNGRAVGSPAAGSSIGVQGESDATGMTSVGVAGHASGDAELNFGVTGYATGGNFNCGVWGGQADGSGTNWAGFFEGRVHAESLAIGTITPTERLDVNGTIKGTGFVMPTGAGSGKVLTSDANGVGTWQAAASQANGWKDLGTVVSLDTDTDSVGVGTAAPTAKLEVSGDFKASGKGTFGSCTNSGNNSFAAGENNTVSGSRSSVTGGLNNVVSGATAFVGGGESNSASGLNAVVGGGIADTASGNNATIGGGRHNVVTGSLGDQEGCVIGGGGDNRASGYWATVAGGDNNYAENWGFVGGGRYDTAHYLSVVPGGFSNAALGSQSFAAGSNARAVHSGAFVWADDAGTSFTTTADKQFLIRAGAGVGIGTNSPNSQLHVNGPVATAVAFVAVNTTLGSTHSVVLTNNGVFPITITLPSAVGIAGRLYTIKRTSTAGATISPSGGQTIDGAALYSLAAQWKYVSLVSDGANWVIVANN
jgi:hypothetical protein